MRLRACWIACVAACVGSASASAGDRLWLVRDGQATATIVRGGEDDFAAERLAGWLADRSGAEIDVRTADAEPLPEGGCVVLVGSPASNPVLRKMAAAVGLAIDPAELTRRLTID